MAMLCLSIHASAYDFEVDGIYYNILSLEDLTCEVTYNADNRTTQSRSFYDYRGEGGPSSISSTYPSYTGNVTIPSKVNYKGRELSVTGIGSYAFLNCTGLKSLSLPPSITRIKEVVVSTPFDCYAGAFDYCNIESFTAGNAYTLQMFNQSYALSGYKTKDNLKSLILSDDFSGTISVDFSDYKKLVSIRSNALEVPTFSDTTHFTNEQFLNANVWVPENVFSLYQSADIWSKFWELKAMKLVKSIALNEFTLSLEPSQTVQLVATISPEDVFDSSLQWNSSNPDVASVNADGIVTAITKGDAVISASSIDGSNISAECKVYVDLLVKELILSETEVGLEPGNTRKLEVTIRPENAFVKDVVWASDDDNIASVDQNGNVTANKEGVTNITVQTTDGSNLKATCKVTVAKLVESITVSPNSATINEGESILLSYIIAPETATYKDVLWTSEDNDVATVDANGLVTAVSSGTTSIKAIATDGSDVYGECEVTVTADTFNINGICYQRNSPNTLKVVANADNPYSGDFIIPTSANLNGQEMTVTGIGANAFSGCLITRIVIPNTIKKIDGTAFTRCNSLNYVRLDNGSSLVANFDKLFPNSPINELYIGSDSISYSPNSRLLRIVKGMTLGNSVSTFPPTAAFESLKWFIVEDGDQPIIEPYDYCSDSRSLISKETIRDTYTLIYYRFFYLIKYTHLSPILNALENSTLNFLHIGREVKCVELDIDTSLTQELIPTTAGDRYQEYGYRDEVNYQYQENISKKDFNRNPIESISFDKPLIEMNVGDCIKPEVNFTPANASFTSIQLTSSDENIVSVDIFGNVTKVSDGDATITATTIDGTNLSAMCKVSIKPRIESISLSPIEWSGFKGESFKIEATILPEDVDDKTLTWTSSDESVAKVDDMGQVETTGIGKCIITATAVDGSEVNATCTVTVMRKLVESLIINPEEFLGTAGDSFIIETSVLPEDATNKKLRFSSDNTRVAKVDNNGKVTIKNEGIAYIKVMTTDGSDIKAWCVIFSTSGIENLFKDDSCRYDIYTITGMLVQKAADKEYVNRLSKGIYILVSGNKVVKLNLTDK